MNKRELIERIECLKNLFGNKCEYVKIDFVIELASELDELEAGHADEAPRYVKNILARLRELPLHDREVWLKTIMGEFEQDFSRAKWREGYEQGKFEGEWVGQQLKDADKIRQELNKPVVPQIVADYIKYTKEADWDLQEAMDDVAYEDNNDLRKWFNNNIETFARAWLDGYTVEREKRYLVKIKGVDSRTNYLYYGVGSRTWLFKTKLIDGNFRKSHTRKELERDNFGWVFDCPGIDIEEVGK